MGGIITFKLDTSSKAYPLLIMLIGMIAFLISGVIASVFIKATFNYILGTMIAGGIGGLLLSLFLETGKKHVRIVAGSILTMPAGLVLSMLIGYGLSGLLSSISPSLGQSGILDALAIILMNIFYGAVLGALIYGRKSIGVFSFVCGISAIPFGLLIVAMNSGHPIRIGLENLLGFLGKVDINFIIIAASLGAGVGLSIGLYNLLKLKGRNE